MKETWHISLGLSKTITIFLAVPIELVSRISFAGL